MIDLIILNLYGGILPEDGKLVIRRGFFSFLRDHKSKKIAVSSYEHKDRVYSDLKNTGLIKSFDKIYTLEDLDYFPLEKKYLPYLKIWAHEHFNTDEKKILCISNDPRDIGTAVWHGAKAIKIPTFKNIEDQFSFGLISIDSLYIRTRFFFQRHMSYDQMIELNSP